MRRTIIILMALLLCSLGISADDKCGCECEPCCDPVVYSCNGPPFSFAGCDAYTCGEQFALGYLHGGWSETEANLVIHSNGPVELWVTWVPAWNDPNNYIQLGTRQFYFDGGDYTIPARDIIVNYFDHGSTALGALWIEWRGCGDSLVYFDAWNERRKLPNDGGFGQRASFENAVLCPESTGREVGGVCPTGLETYITEGCYEVPVPAGTDFIRGQIINRSETDWQSVFIQGVATDIPPLIPEYPELAIFNFVPWSSLVTVCIGKETPWSGGREYGDSCVIANFEAIDTDTRRRISIPVRPLILMDQDLTKVRRGATLVLD